MTHAVTPQDHFVEVNGLRLHYLDYGNAEGPPLIMIHGLSGHAHTFDLVAPHLIDRYHPISIDVRGRGESGWAPDGDYSTQAYMSDLVELLVTLDLERVSVIGTSMGGLIAMMLAAQRPDLVERAVINDIGPEIDPRGLRRIQAYVADAPAGFADQPSLLLWFRQNYPEMLGGLSDEQLRAWATYSVKPAPDGGFVWRMDPAIRQAQRPAAGSTTALPDLWSLVLDIRCPVLLVRGEVSDVLSPAVAERFVNALPEGRLVEVPGLGHAPTLIEPEAVAALRSFLPGDSGGI